MKKDFSDQIHYIEDGGVTSPMGYRASAVSADIKGNGKDRLDLALLLSDNKATVSSFFTTNLVKAAPVQYDIKIMSKDNPKISAIIVNSGNANACTGIDGDNDCISIVSALSKKLKINQDEIFISSTGVIGSRLPADKIVAKLDPLIDALDDDDGDMFADAILTTDQFRKEVAVISTYTNNNGEPQSFIIGGTTKGAGMIAPSLATMLAFITTDVEIDKPLLDKILKTAIDKSFNSISVDGDMSTNDTVVVLANATCAIKIDESNVDIFTEALERVLTDLALMIVEDAEGGTKLVTLIVKGAKTDTDAKLCASKIANSPLVKTMFTGNDPNWGRLMSSAGASGADFDPNNVDIFFQDSDSENPIHYVKNGLIIDNNLESSIHQIMLKPKYTIIIDLNKGDGFTKFYTSDLTIEYIKINADYRS